MAPAAASQKDRQAGPRSAGQLMQQPGQTGPPEADLLPHPAQQADEVGQRVPFPPPLQSLTPPAPDCARQDADRARQFHHGSSST